MFTYCCEYGISATFDNVILCNAEYKTAKLTVDDSDVTFLTQSLQQLFFAGHAL